MNSISRGQRPAVSYFQAECDNVITYTERNLLLNCINIGLAIRLYRQKIVILQTELLHRLQFDPTVNSYFNQFSTCQYLQRFEEHIQLCVIAYVTGGR